MEKCLLQCGRPGLDPWLRKIPWRRKWQPTPLLLSGKFHGLRSLVGYSPWGRKELDTSNFTSMFFYFPIYSGVFSLLHKGHNIGILSSVLCSLKLSISYCFVYPYFGSLLMN